ncbi:hypothetical protein NDU88_004142 [Pleurodeles waltl]|uniref:Uncharacterized protein n=1 Tax=Pleurodeles waltl TaxID=8319 RepID=A0AAV7NMP7_PLEWA|nr:hypothetical protein NDU88_004142 [Pleurodeles waltl]
MERRRSSRSVRGERQGRTGDATGRESEEALWDAAWAVTGDCVLGMPADSSSGGYEGGKDSPVLILVAPDDLAGGAWTVGATVGTHGEMPHLQIPSHA